MEINYPLISCICITNRRIVLLQKAIGYFQAQDYPSKELIVSYPENDRLTKFVLKQYSSRTDINLVMIERPCEESLGDARNEAVYKSNGEFICIWDDDDWYHPTRLSFQFNSMRNAGENYAANILNQVLLYDKSRARVYLSFLYMWEGTLMCKKEVLLKYQYYKKHIGEDTGIVESLDKEKLLYHIWNASFLYIYTYHNGNVWHHSHFKYFFKRSKLLDESLGKDIKALLS